MNSAPRVYRRTLKVFAAYSRGYLRRRFHSLRVLKGALPPRDCRQPVAIYLNHAAWWDPLVCLVLAREFFPSRSSFAPIDAAMLERYRIFKRLGFFGIEKGTTRGARTFLRTAQSTLASSANALWLTPQARFADVRERPPRLQDGLGALATLNPSVAFIPLAIEYSFWTEPRPEILVAFGSPIFPMADRTAGEWTRIFTRALEQTQDELAAHSRSRHPADWLVLNRGKSGVNAIYDAWRGLRARFGGQPFARPHDVELSR